jgi:hypothetical protein
MVDTVINKGAPAMRRLFVGTLLAVLIAVPAVACQLENSDAAQVSPPGAIVDQFLPSTKLTDAKRVQVEQLRADITRLTAADKITEARALEAQAIDILGLLIARPACNPGPAVPTTASPRM